MASDARLLSPPMRNCSAHGCAIAQPADAQLLSTPMRDCSAHRCATAQPADAGGRIKPGVERFCAEPQEAVDKNHLARGCGRQRNITDIFHRIQCRSLPKTPRTHPGKIFSDDALSVAQCNPALSQRSIDLR